MNDISQLSRWNASRSSSRLFAVLIGLAAAHTAGCHSVDDLPLEHLGNTHDELPLGAPPAGSSPFDGHWLGHAESSAYRGADGQPAVYTFPSGSTDFVLDFDFDGEVFVAGSIVFGAGAVPEPESGVAYPPGFDELPTLSYRPMALEGFVYRLTDVTDSFGEPGSKVFAYEQSEAYATWCPLQPSILVEAGYYNCSGAGGGGGSVSEDGGPSSCFQTFADGSSEPVDCGFATLCMGHVCECDAQGCAYNREMVGQIFVTLDGSELSANFPGTVVEGAGSLGTVRFERLGSP